MAAPSSSVRGPRMKTYFLKLTSAIVIDGQISRGGEIIEVSEIEAKNLLHRGKAVLATAADGVEPAKVHQEDDGQEIAQWPKQKLLDYAKKHGIEVADGMTRAKLVEIIEAHEEAE